jgi:hypothetical protein
VKANVRYMKDLGDSDKKSISSAEKSQFGPQSSALPLHSMENGRAIPITRNVKRFSSRSGKYWRNIRVSVLGVGEATWHSSYVGSGRGWFGLR